MTAPIVFDRMADVERCPMCGEIKLQSDRTLTDRTPAEKVLWELGNVVEAYGANAVALVLLRCRRPRSSSRELARAVGMSAAGGYRLYCAILKTNPELARFVRGAVKTRGLSGGRKPVGKP